MSPEYIQIITNWNYNINVNLKQSDIFSLGLSFLRLI